MSRITSIFASAALVLAISLSGNTGLSTAHADAGSRLRRTRNASMQTLLGSLIKGKVTSFAYTNNLPDPVFSYGGCIFELDTVPGTKFAVDLLPASEYFAATHDGMCRTALDALKSGFDIQVSAFDDDRYGCGLVDMVMVTR